MGIRYKDIWVRFKHLIYMIRISKNVSTYNNNNKCLVLYWIATDNFGPMLCRFVVSSKFV